MKIPDLLGTYEREFTQDTPNQFTRGSKVLENIRGNNQGNFGVGKGWNCRDLHRVYQISLLKWGQSIWDTEMSNFRTRQGWNYGRLHKLHQINLLNRMKVVGAQKEQFQGKKRVNSQGFTHVVPNQSTQREVNTWGAKRVISGLKGMKLQNTKTQENTKSTCNKRMHGIWITKMAQTHQ